LVRVTGQDIMCTALRAPLEGWVETVREFQPGGKRGVNISAPFGLQAQLPPTMAARACPRGARRHAPAASFTQGASIDAVRQARP
jgi:hypothetical protein